MSGKRRLHSSGSVRLSLDSKTHESSELKKSLRFKERFMLFTQLQGYSASPKATTIASSTRNIQQPKHTKGLSSSSKGISNSRSPREAKRLAKENFTLKEQDKDMSDHSETTTLRNKLAEYEATIEKLQSSLESANAENTRLRTEKQSIEAACKEVCFLLTANAVAANQKAIVRLRRAIKEQAKIISHTSRSTPRIVLDEEPRLDEGIRLKSSTTSNQAASKRRISSPYNSSPGALHKSRKVGGVKSQKNFSGSTSYPLNRSFSECRSDSSLGSNVDIQGKLQYIHDKTKTILKAWSHHSNQSAKATKVRIEDK